MVAVLIAAALFAGTIDVCVCDERGSRWCVAATAAAFSTGQLVESRYKQLAGGCEVVELHRVY